MLTAIGIAAAVLAVAVLGVLAYAATKPDTFRVQRAITIAAPPDRIFGLIEDLHGWAAWSPYETKDPAMRRSFSGAPRGRGAVYEWDGNKNVGKGRMEIVEASPPSKIVIKLDFISPFEGHNTAEFTIIDNGSTSDVVWAMYGPAPLMSKLLQVFCNMDRMIGDDFAAGLANLKAIAET